MDTPIKSKKLLAEDKLRQHEYLPINGMDYRWENAEYMLDSLLVKNHNNVFTAIVDLNGLVTILSAVEEF